MATALLLPACKFPLTWGIEGRQEYLDYRRRRKMFNPITCVTDDLRTTNVNESPDLPSKPATTEIKGERRDVRKGNSGISAAAAYKEGRDKQSSSSSAAMAALERAKAYRNQKNLGNLKFPAAESMDPGKTPQIPPSVEVIRGKDPLTSTPSNGEKTVSGTSTSATGNPAAPSDCAAAIQPSVQPSDAATSASAKIGPSRETELQSSGKNKLNLNVESVRSSSVETTRSPEFSQQQRQDSQGMGDDSRGAIVSLSNMILENDYKQQQSEMIIALKESKGDNAGSAPPEASPYPSKSSDSVQTSSSPALEIEIFTRDGVIRRKVPQPGEMISNVKGIKSQGISSKDFMGLGFADKKELRTAPAGLQAAMDMPSGALPQVEIITRDVDAAAGSGNGSEFYKPKVATWGVFPRPKDISRAYGGGRTIRPGESLETPEEKEARESETRRLLEEYRRISGVDIDSRVKVECEKAIEIGVALMDSGKLREAVQEFDSVVSKTVFKNILHGRALLQKALCLDSMARSREAKELYEILAGHPHVSVRKKARQLLFGFQAAENLRIEGGYSYDSSAYRKYFDAFADGYNTLYKGSDEESDTSLLQQSLPYMFLLVMPLLLAFVAIMIKASSS